MSDLPNVVPPADRAAMRQLVAALKTKVTAIPSEPIDVWIDGSGHVRRVEVDVSETVAGKSVTVKTTEDLSDYGPQPVPAAPSAGETSNLLSLIKNEKS